MSFGLYIHIPYCEKRCAYCDFATYEPTDIMPFSEYFKLLKLELKNLHPLITEEITSIYFGGGTPSFVPPEYILSIIEEIAIQKIAVSDQCEKTIEINPASGSAARISRLVEIGFNRFSVGFQTSHAGHLKILNRAHKTSQSLEVLQYLLNNNLNFSTDLLFALPHQTVAELDEDIDFLLGFRPKHISPYCLTLSKSHPLTALQPLEDLQVEMFGLIYQRLTENGYRQYEISNFSLPGFESKHNLIYWTDQPYLGIGLSAHSYLKSIGPWGVRFWNSASPDQYRKNVVERPAGNLEAVNFYGEGREVLAKHQSVTDYCHTSLRISKGLSLDSVRIKYGSVVSGLIQRRLTLLSHQNLVQEVGSCWCLTRDGVLLSNRVFEALTILPEDKL